jgi:hypothetical protein
MNWAFLSLAHQACTTYLFANPIFHRRMKHVEVNYHFVREQVSRCQLEVRPISSKDQIADVMTKPLPLPLFSKFCGNLNVVSPSQD